MRHYSNLAVPQALQTGIDVSATEVEVVDTEGYPDVPFIISVGRLEDFLNEVPELMRVTAKTATTFTVERGVEGTEAAAHLAGERVEHVSSAYLYREIITAAPEYQLEEAVLHEGKVIVVTNEGEDAPEPEEEEIPVGNF